MLKVVLNKINLLHYRNLFLLLSSCYCNSSTFRRWRNVENTVVCHFKTSCEVLIYFSNSKTSQGSNSAKLLQWQSNIPFIKGNKGGWQPSNDIITQQLSITTDHTWPQYGSHIVKIMNNQNMIYRKRGSTGSIDGLEVIQQHQADEIDQETIHSIKDI